LFFFFTNLGFRNVSDDLLSTRLPADALMGYRSKLLLSMLLLNVVLFLVVILFGIHYMQNQAQEDFVEQEMAIADVLSLAIAHPLHEQHEAEIYSVLDKIIGKHALVAALVTDINGHSYANGLDNLEFSAYPEVSEFTGNPAGNEFFIIRKTVTFHDEPTGELALVVTNSPVQTSVKSVLIQFSPVLLMTLIGVILVNTIFKRVLNRQLLRLEEGAKRISEGELGYKIPVESNDELSQAIQAFNRMSDTTVQLYHKLETSRIRLDATINTVLDGIVTIGEDGLIRSVNKAVTTIFGYSEDELLGQNVAKLMPAPHSQRHDGYLAAYLNGRSTGVIGQRRELQGLKKDGTEFPLELSVTEIAVTGEKLFVGSIRSLEDIYEVNAQLLQAKSLHSRLFESALDAIVTISNDGRILSMNYAAEVLFGVTKEQANGYNYSDLVVFDENHMQSVTSLTGTKSLNNSIEMSAVTADGRQIPVEVSMVSLQQDDHYVINAFIHDISARKEAEQQLLAAKKAAEAASLAKSDFLAVMSHEIRTPINVVLGALSILGDSQLNDYQKRFFNVARESGNSLLWLVNDILDFSKIEAGKLEIDHAETSPALVVDEVINMLFSRAEQKSIELVSAFAADFPGKMVSDPVRLRQILINLIGNAIKFTEHGGVFVKCVCEGDSGLLFHIIDTGIGIPDSRYDDLFEQFNQLDASTTRRFGGTGLGLSISKKLADLMGGSLTVWSEPGVGSQFTLRLPLVEPGKTVIDLSHVSARLKLQLYDDNPVSVAAFKYQMEQLGVELEIFESIDQHVVIDVQEGDRQRRFHLLRHDETAPENSSDIYLHKPLELKVLCTLVSSKLMDANEAFVEKRVIDRERFRGQPLLLVEDSPANQLIARTMLENAGYIVDVANDGQQAVDMVMQKQYALVLMDISMPVMDGMTATQIIRSLPGPVSKTVIVAMTANVFKDDIQRCYDIGMQDFIAKPIDKKRMFDVIQKNLSDNSVEIAQVALDSKETVDNISSEVIDCLNYKVIDELINDIGMEVVPDMLRIYIEETRQREELIQAAVISMDYETLRSESHALKSSSGSVGLVTLQKQAMVIEAACRQENFDEAVAAATSLPKLVQSCLAELERYMARLPSES
jgi:two-component system sensor histidine kinase/response regulator